MANNRLRNSPETWENLHIIHKTVQYGSYLLNSILTCNGVTFKTYKTILKI